MRWVGRAGSVGCLRAWPGRRSPSPRPVRTDAEHFAEDAAPHDAAAESQLTRTHADGHGAGRSCGRGRGGGNEHEVGSWGPLVDWPVVGVHVALLPNGKVLAYDSVGDRATETFPSTRSPAPRCGTRRPGRRRRRT